MPLLSTLPAQASRQWRRRRLLNPMQRLAQAKSAENVQSALNTRNAGDSQPADTVEQHAEVAQPEAAREAEAAQSENTQPETAQPATAQSETDQPAADVPDDQQRTAAEAYQEATAAGVADQQPAAEKPPSSRYPKHMISTPRAYINPVFEPGSVFERVAKGELKAQEPAVEVDGLTSDEAKPRKISMFNLKSPVIPELLAFLAMNPYLYDDMYSWLAARGEADIDEALSHNKGYQEYREAVGK